jgi:hypothetical protein
MSIHLPHPAELERRARLVAFLDTLLEPDFALRYFDFSPTWDEGERLLSIRSGEGDHAFVWFGPQGTLVRGRHSEADPVPSSELFAGLPESLHALRDEAAFQVGGDSFAAWRLASDSVWRWAIDPSNGRLDELISALGADPSSFAEYAEPYHDQKLDRAALGALYEGGAVSAAWLAQLGVRSSVKRAVELARELGLKVVRETGKRKSEAMAKSKSKTSVKAQAGDPHEDDETLGEAEFKVIRVGDETRLVVAGKVQLRAKKQGLYLELLEAVRAALRAGS